MIDYNTYTVASLREAAKKLGVVGYSKMRKAEIIAAIQEKDLGNCDVDGAAAEKVTVMAQGNRESSPETFGKKPDMAGKIAHSEVSIEAKKEESNSDRLVYLNDSTFDVVLSKDVGSIIDREVFHNKKEDESENGDKLPLSMNRRQRRKMAKIAKLRATNPKANLRKMMARA